MPWRGGAKLALLALVARQALAAAAV
eukprot:SAG22_NODE_17427_length_305_cov_0.752427_1_plen_25_part_01